MLENLKTSTFSNLIGQSFSVEVEEGPTVSLELVTVTPGLAIASEKRQRAPFSVVFHGPPEPLLPQRIYRFENSDLGTFDLFIVPIGYHEAGGVEYEAVFG